MTFKSPKLEAYMILAQELFRRIYAEDSPEEIHRWLLAQIQKLGGNETEARLGRGPLGQAFWIPSILVYLPSCPLLTGAERHCMLRT